MRMRQAPLSYFCAAAFAAVMLTGCLGGRLHSEEPPGVRLQGVWKLNRGASQDPQKIIDALRAQAEKKSRRALNAPPVPVSSGGGGGGRTAEGKAQPEALGARTGEEGVAGEALGVGWVVEVEVANVADVLDLGEWDGGDAAGEIEEVDDTVSVRGAGADEAGQGEIAREGVSEKAANDDLFVRRRHGSP